MPEYFDFEVSLVGVEPRIWRRFLLRNTLSFQALHEAIQNACGWWNHHLFSFRETRRGPEIARDNFEDPFEPPEKTPIAGRVRLATWFKKEGDRCWYNYDFGDCWWHMVRLKDVIERPQKFRRRLLDGERAFPPEDCGGLRGYEECCRAFALTEGEIRELDPVDRDNVESRRQWMGDWAPAIFDLVAVKKVFDE